MKLTPPRVDGSREEREVTNNAEIQQYFRRVKISFSPMGKEIACENA